MEHWGTSRAGIEAIDNWAGSAGDSGPTLGRAYGRPKAASVAGTDRQGCELVSALGLGFASCLPLPLLCWAPLDALGFVPFVYALSVSRVDPL